MSRIKKIEDTPYVYSKEYAPLYYLLHNLLQSAYASVQGFTPKELGRLTAYINHPRINRVLNSYDSYGRYNPQANNLARPYLDIYQTELPFFTDIYNVDEDCLIKGGDWCYEIRTEEYTLNEGITNGKMSEGEKLIKQYAKLLENVLAEVNYMVPCSNILDIVFDTVQVNIGNDFTNKILNRLLAKEAYKNLASLYIDELRDVLIRSSTKDKAEISTIIIPESMVALFELDSNFNGTYGRDSTWFVGSFSDAVVLSSGHNSPIVRDNEILVLSKDEEESPIVMGISSEGTEGFKAGWKIHKPHLIAKLTVHNLDINYVKQANS